MSDRTIEELNERVRKLEQRNEIDDAVRARVAKEVAEQARSNGLGCFPPNSIAQLEDGSNVTMADLRLGQKVLSSFSNGKANYSIVYFFAHQDDKSSTEYISILTQWHTINLTPDHHIYITDCGRLHTVPARDVKVGDTVMVVSRDNSCLEEETVTELSKSTDVGIYAPITMSGTIVVNSVLASCYVDVVPPQIAHPLLWPARQLYQLSPSLSTATNIHGKHGMPIWVKWFMDNILN
ncbi:hypothetical protein CHS0354_028920 [Potamilus streckersoni]|uniref:Hint domain-containing protein n=1 Tax=Potamilus streckersoni TaxID=2493646 RepID=A0AAE0VWT0_9BIVA|nr:hypothetical protein CHS0354_028920 [Potamilus streckersoni]